MNPESMSAQSRRRSPSEFARALDTTTAPPDSAMSLPITVPRAITIATNPSVSPTPAWNARGMSASGMRAASPTKSAATASARKAGTRSHVMSRTTSATPRNAMIRRGAGSIGVTGQEDISNAVRGSLLRAVALKAVALKQEEREKREEIL